MNGTLTEPHPAPDGSLPDGRWLAEGDGVCRDCLAIVPPAKKRCPNCGRPRLIYHPELHRLSIAHIDCDAFYASVEKRDNPELADKPVIIGGGTRGVVSTCCYVARLSGVRSAMPMFQALKKCPEAVVIKPDMAKYVAVGRQIREMMQALTPLVEPLSIDEAFLDLTGTEQLHKAAPALVLARFARKIEEEIGITISVGLAANKFLAKIASDLKKPRGFAVIGSAEAAEFLAPRPVSFIWGVGAAMAQKMQQDGFATIADLQKSDVKTLAKLYGSMGLRLAELAFGRDSRTVEPSRERKSLGHETTFNTDIADLANLRPVLRRLCEKVAADLKKVDLAGHTVTLKLKTADFKLRSRRRTLSDPTQLADKLFHIADALLATEADGTAYRLIGVTVSDFAESRLADPKDLIDTQSDKRAKAERAMDQLRGKFGERSVDLGILFADPQKGRR